MNFPRQGDFIDIHTHHSTPEPGVFAVENVMVHEVSGPGGISAQVFTAGIHPWFLDEKNSHPLLEIVRMAASMPGIIAIGEAGFDRLRGPSPELQLNTFEDQAEIAKTFEKPMVIHCVKAWDELLFAHKKIKPSTSWLIHGFRGKKELASQLLSRGMYISVWFEFALRDESAELVKFVPKERLFLETDGSGADIRDIYKKVSDNLGISSDELKRNIIYNYKVLFGSEQK